MDPQRVGEPGLKSVALLALLLAGLVLRMQGWQLLCYRQTVTGALLVICGTLVTLSIVAALAMG
jgi:hypothetical protein